MRFLPLALWLAGVAMGQGAPDVPVPDAVKGSGLEYVPWVWQTFGWPGLCLLLGGLGAQQTMKVANEFRGVPVRLEGPLVIQVDPNGPPVVIQLHADTVSKFVPRKPVVTES